MELPGGSPSVSELAGDEPVVPSPAPLVRARGLTKYYGNLRALDRFELTVAPGEVVGVIGPNGAGKTTALRLLTGLIAPTSGEARIAGLDPVAEPVEARKRLGLLTSTAGLYQRLSVREMLEYFAELAGLSPQTTAERVTLLADSLGISDLLGRRCDRLSAGQRQRVSIARAVVHDPDVLLFDEPTAGLDLIAARTVHGMARASREAGRAILWCTHDMTEAELLCDRVVLLFAGRVRASGTIAEICSRFDVASLADAFLSQVEG